jgi:hypothetical protein
MDSDRDFEYFYREITLKFKLLYHPQLSFCTITHCSEELSNLNGYYIGHEFSIIVYHEQPLQTYIGAGCNVEKS